MSLPLGYRYSAVYAGIRKTKKNDLALIWSDTPASAAAVFTSNIVKAAPVLTAQANLRASKGTVRAVLINAGNANCATRTGAAVARATTTALAKHLKAPANQIFPASTGVIGVELNPALITNALPALVAEASPEKFDHVALAIMTTDIVPKSISAGLELKQGEVRIAGMTKGSGMIHPNMATTLGFVMTDAAITPAQLQPILRRATNLSYNRISVDGDQSTNDTVVVLANGASGVTLKGRDLAAFEESLTYILQSLAMQIARDGEGARKLVTIHVEGAKNEPQAAQIARSIANSPLVKTAIAGGDANWGRVVMAVGKSGEAANRDKLSIKFGGHRVATQGLRDPNYSEALMSRYMQRQEIEIDIDVGVGKGASGVWTCDLTHGYISINGDYRS